MKAVLKWVGIVLGSLLVLIVVAAIVLSILGGAQLNETREIQAIEIVIPTDKAALARGEHLVNVSCKDCHGADLAGQVMIDGPPIGTVYAANITGLADTHTDADIVRAIRHGLDTDGRQLMIMPSESFIYFSAEDLGAIIAHLKSLPRIGEEFPTPELALLGRILTGAGMLDAMFPAEYIDHSMPFPEMPAVAATVEYGEYATRFCYACHGDDLAGGQPPDPDSPPAPDLTTSGELRGWTEEDFFTAMRTGVIPSGRQLNPAYMPWESFGKFRDEELQAMWMSLQSSSAAQ